jgi:superfamily II DNA/RNA helicase
MLDMDFEKKINFIIFKLNDKRKELNLDKPQTILISATLTNGIKEIARRLNVEDAISIDTSSSNDRSNPKESDESNEKIAIPSSLKNYYMISPTKLRLIALISFILDKICVSAQAIAVLSARLLEF